MVRVYAGPFEGLDAGDGQTGFETFSARRTMVAEVAGLKYRRQNMNKNANKMMAACAAGLLAVGHVLAADGTWVSTGAVSYTHLTLPTNREV